MKVAILLVFWLCVPALADLAARRQAFKNGDYAKALRELLPLAKQGDEDAQVFVAFMYQKGDGVPQDYSEAAKWYRLAAEQGDALAQEALGSMYSKGAGVPQDDKEALRWYGLAAAQGYPRGEFNLGFMYQEGPRCRAGL